MLLSPHEYLTKVREPGFQAEVSAIGRVVVGEKGNALFRLEWSGEVTRQVYVKSRIKPGKISEATEIYCGNKDFKFTPLGYISAQAMIVLTIGLRSDHYWGARWEPVGTTHLAVPYMQTPWMCQYESTTPGAEEGQ